MTWLLDNLAPKGTVPFALLVVARVAFTTTGVEQFTAAIVNFVVRTLQATGGNQVILSTADVINTWRQ